MTKSRRARSYFRALYRADHGIVARCQRRRAVARGDRAKLRRWASERWVRTWDNGAILRAAFRGRGPVERVGEA